MINSYTKILDETIPAIDKSDVISNLASERFQSRQFAPEYSQRVYETMRSEEQLIGDYTFKR